MDVSRLSSDPNVVLDIVAEAMKKQQDLVQKITRAQIELDMKAEKMETANEALVDFYG